MLFGIVSFIASIAGAICGIGGGVIIKPTLDLIGWASVSTISFLSGCTVLSKRCYSVGRSMLSGEKSVDVKTGTPLAIGAAAGGVLGGIVGRSINKKIDSKAVDKLFICLMVVIIGISLWNTYRYLVIGA